MILAQSRLQLQHLEMLQDGNLLLLMMRRRDVHLLMMLMSVVSARVVSRNRPRKKSAGMKRVREPRYSIKTRTDVDIMDDGFKWRKYGQKAVKNSPHPRYSFCCELMI
jgi:hypothetical protein